MPRQLGLTVHRGTGDRGEDRDLSDQPERRGHGDVHGQPERERVPHARVGVEQPQCAATRDGGADVGRAFPLQALEHRDAGSAD